MNEQKMYAKLIKWTNEYLAGYTGKFRIIDVGYDNLNNLMGKCIWQTTWHFKNNRYEFEIYVNEVFEKDDFATEVILWHEFAHLMDVVKNGNGEHDKGWIKEWLRKPLMTLPAYIAILPIVLYRFIMEDVKK